jgi:hypothetical protein
MGLEKNYKKSPIKMIIGASIVVVMLIILGIGKLINDVKNELDKGYNPKSDRKYEVRLSNWVGSNYYYCDSIAKEDNIITMFNTGEDDETIIITIPENVTLQIKENLEYKKPKYRIVNPIQDITINQDPDNPII